MKKRITPKKFFAKKNKHFLNLIILFPMRIEKKHILEWRFYTTELHE